MKHSFLRLAAAAALCTLALGSQAQYGTSASPAAAPAGPTTPTATPTQTDADYAANVARCNRLMGAAKADCLQDARAAYDRAVKQTPSGLGAAGGGGMVGSGQGVKRN